MEKQKEENGVPQATFNITEEFEEKKRKKRRFWRALIAYWVLGLANNYGYVVMLSAAHDILRELDGTGEEQVKNVTSGARDCNRMSTGAILLADIVPSLLIKLLAPYLPFFVHVRVGICVLTAAGGFLAVAFANSDALAIFGVVVTSLSSGLGEVSFLQYSAFYSKNVVSTWSSGTGGAGVLGAVSYAALSGLGLRNALLIMLVVPAFMAVAFWIVLPRPEEDNAQLFLQPETGENLMESFLAKIKLVPGLFKYMLPLGAVYLFEYFINQGLFELIEYDNIFITHAEQYRWLQVLYQVGVFISRSSVNLLHVRKIWLFAVLQFLNVAVFTCEAIFAYIPSIWIIFILTLWEGLLGGGAYVNTFYKISHQEPEERKQFSMSTTSLSDTIGITLAGILALPSHNAICDLPKPTRLTF